MFCEDCGSQAPVTDHFCRTCGQALGVPSALESAAILSMEEPGHPTEESRAAEASASPPPVGLTIPMALSVSEGTSESADLPVSEFAFPNEAKAKMTHAGSVHRRRWLVLFAAVTLTVVGLLAVVASKTGSGMPPDDPAQALHRLKDVANIDLPIDDGAVDTGMVLVPMDMPQRPSSMGKYFGAVWMESGSTVELRVSAYALASDAAQNARWWNTSGIKEYYNGSMAAQCGRIVLDGAWVDRHTKEETVKLLHQAYPDCTPYVPEKALAPASASSPAPAPAPTAEPAPQVEERPTPLPTLTRTPPPRVYGREPSGAPGEVVAGAFVITNLVVSNKNPNNTTVSFTVKNSTRLKLLLIPAVEVSDGNGTPGSSTTWGGDQGIGTPCYVFGPNESNRITIRQGYSSGDGGFPTNWTSAVVTNVANNCAG